jgi:hypothetical protein
MSKGPTPTPTPTPSPPSTYTAPPLATDGTLLPLVPFELSVFPLTINVQADRQSGLFSGDFEVGVLIKPGPTQYRSAEITDLVRLYATGDSQVQFFSQLPYTDAPNFLEVQTTPVNWDLQTGYLYDLTCVINVINYSDRNRVVFLSASVTNLDNVPQVVATLDHSNIPVRSGSNKIVLMALTVSAIEAARSDISVSAWLTDAVLPTSHVMVNCDPNAGIPEFYQITTPSTLTVKVGTSVSITFTTAGGEEGPVIWAVTDPQFLVDHGLRFTADGILKSDGNVLGPTTEISLMFTVRKETGLTTRMYASKVIDLIISGP